MYVAFNELPDTSRIWIYQADRKLGDKELRAVHKMLEDFTESWQSHGAYVNASYQVVYKQFIILAVDEATAPSGCSIDKSVGIMKEIAANYNIDLFNRTNIAHLTPDGSVEMLTTLQVRTAIEEGVITPNTLVFNNIITTKQQIEEEWIVAAKDTWVSRYF